MSERTGEIVLSAYSLDIVRLTRWSSHQNEFVEFDLSVDSYLCSKMEVFLYQVDVEVPFAIFTMFFSTKVTISEEVMRVGHAVNRPEPSPLRNKFF
jgi:hypothetical protein